MTISISSDFENFINQQVKAGVYNSSNEAIEHAFQLLRDRELIKKQRITELNAEIKKGFDSAESDNLISESELKQHIANRRQKFLDNNA
jgi:putative addiction module CopG family antidote